MTGDKLKETRERWGYSQSTMARELGVSLKRLKGYESRGPRDVPRLIKLATEGLLLERNAMGTGMFDGL